VIETEHLCKKFGEFTAVHDLNLNVAAGELFCFLGPNGAGKTTTIKMLTGLLRPSGGRARVGGYDIREQALEAKRRIGYIPDMPYLYDRLTAVEFFEFIGDLYAVPSAKIETELEAAFQLFSLNEHRSALVKDLSHGLKQRLIYASTLLHEPQVMFIDEPLIGLDPYTIRLIKDLLKAKARAGMTIFLTTHILALAADIADRIAIIFRGRVVESGTLEDLLSRHGGDSLEDVFLKLTADAVAGEARR
jgi:ABC-2 type transport system ATP-binding protein